MPSAAVAAPADRNHGSADASWPTPPAKGQSDSRSAQAEAIRAAQAKAKSTGKPVVVDAMTTGGSQTTANPDGTLTTDSSPVVERIKNPDGTWRAVDATLRTNPDGTVAPTAVPSGLTFSGGGTNPLATMATADGKKLSIKAPFTLPKPELTGSSALYRSVLPDVDLEMSATPAGGWRQVLIVRTAQAAADPKIKKLHLDTAADGLTVKADATGNLSAEDASGKARFTAPPPVLWDSSTTPAAEPKTAAKSAAAPAADGAAEAAGSDSKAPGPGARTAPIATTVSDGGIDLVPDASVLGQGTGPWFIDPGWNPSVDNGTLAWAQVQEAYPDMMEYNGTQLGQDKPASGYCGYINSANKCEREGRERAYFQVGLNPAFWGSTVLSAKLYATVAQSSSPSTSTPMGLYSTRTDDDENPINAWTRWNAQPCPEPGKCTRVATTQISGGGGKEFDVYSQMAQAAAGGWHNWTFMFAPDDERNKLYRQRWANNPHVVVTYDLKPRIGDPATSPTPGFAWNDSHDKCQTGGTTDPKEAPGWVGINTDINLSVDTWSPTGEQLWTAFRIWDDNDDSLKIYETGWAASSGLKNVSVGPLIDGHQYGWFATTTDGTLTSDNSPTCYLRIDRTPPTARITSMDFPESGTLGGHPKPVGEDGYFTLTGTDPAPATGGQSSGLACARWTTDPIQASATGWKCTDRSDNIVKMDGGSYQLKHHATHWGTNFLYLQTQDNAGNMSQPVAYTFFAPSNPNAGDPIMGDIDSDRKADILLPDGTGSLRLVGPATDPYSAPNTVQASAPGAAGNKDWSTVQISHRGSFSARNVDDLVAHAPGSAHLYLYVNEDGTGRLDRQAAVDLKKSGMCFLPSGTSITCSTYKNGSDWSAVTQIAAFGSPAGDTPSDPGTSTAGLPSSSLLYVEDGRLWLALQNSSKLLDGPTILLSQNKTWSDYDLITPGPTKGTSIPTVWARSKVDGTIHAYQLAPAPGDTYDASAFADPATGKVADGIDARLYPKVGSSGDVTGDGVPDLWAVDTNNQLVVWAGTGAPKDKDNPSSGPTVTGVESTPVVLGNLNRPAGNWLAAPDGTNTVRDEQKRADGWATNVGWVEDTVDGRKTTVGTFTSSAGSNITMSGPVVDTRKSFTISTWAKAGSGPGVVASQETGHSSNFLLYTDGAGKNWHFGLAYTDDDTWSYDFTDTQNASAETRPGAWTRLTASYNADTGAMALYVDGVLAGTKFHRAGTSPASSGPFTLGRYKYQSKPTASFDGSISSTAVYPFAVAPTAPGATSVVRSGVDAGMCVDDINGSKDDGNPIMLVNCNGSEAQQLALGNDGTVRVKGGCIATVNAGTVDGTQLEYHSCDGTTAQKWIPLANGALFHPASGKCFELPGGPATSGTRLQIAGCGYGPNQQWSIPTLRTAVLPAPPRS
ncbi:ricin-type beta-trefoil lectin domain protein [Kitasatospora sp. NPDC057512]|uniref:ricin-type beta-trefoil lectin domain protein n=1 Tax=Kitasatospora sp. NPDC057512 TaxID=3346154 RepID=UPI0036B70FA0